MDTINYSDNPNGKLFMDCHTTIRENYPEKYFVGAELRVTLKGVEMGIVKVVALRPFKYGAIRDSIAYLETGHPASYLAELLRRFYRPHGILKQEHDFLHVFLKYKKRNLENQNILIQDWWKSKQQLDMDL